jgi:hypothetical protein
LSRLFGADIKLVGDLSLARPKRDDRRPPFALKKSAQIGVATCLLVQPLVTTIKLPSAGIALVVRYSSFPLPDNRFPPRLAFRLGQRATGGALTDGKHLVREIRK